MSYAYGYDAGPGGRMGGDQTGNEEKEAELLRYLKAEENEALGYRQSELQQQQIDALKHYYGEPYGDEEDGRSKVVTREVFETIEWTRPDMARVFCSGGNILSIEASRPEDEKEAKAAEDYLNWVYFVDNPGFQNTDAFAFDGLLHRRGFMACYWREAEYLAPETLTGLGVAQVQMLMADPDIQIIGYGDGDHDADDNGGPQESDAGGFSLKVRRLKTPARAEIEVIAPEDMRLNGRAVDIDEARYVGRVWRKLRGEVAKLWPEKEDAIMAYSGSAVSGPQNIRRGSDVRMERFKDQSDDWQTIANNTAQQIEVLEEYYRVDLNGDGFPETIRSYRMGDLLLEWEEVNENPFGSWTPIPIPHRFYGYSLHDITQDLQREATVIKRAGLDALYQAVVPREAYDRNKVALDDLLGAYAGQKIGVEGAPGDAIMPLTGGVDTTEIAWKALANIDMMLEKRTGATRQTQGVDADALLTKEHSGKAIDLLQTAGAARKELMARNMGAGLERFFAKLLRLLCRNQHQAKQAKVGGKWCQFDPRAWNEGWKVRVHTGLGTGNREQAMLGVQWMQQVQQTLVQTLGSDNPMVTSQNVYNLIEEGCRNWGYKSAAPFFSEPPEVPVQGPDGQPQIDPQTGQPATKPWSPDPQPSPEMAKVQADAQAKQASHQLDVQAKGASHQLDTEKTAMELKLQEQTAAAQIQLAREKAAAEIQVMREKAAADLELARQQMAMDAELARAKMAQDYELERMRIESAERVGKAKAAATGSGEAPTVDTDVNGQ